MKGVKAIAKQAGIVLVVGIGFALVANLVSPVGLSLTRDYFPAGAALSQSKSSPATTGPGKGATSSSSAVAKRLRGKGLQAVAHDRVVQLYGSQRHREGDVVFIDARGRSKHREGHIPGAYPFSHYRIEDYLQTILPVCGQAEMIVLYCQGADCQDSEMAALGLRDLGISPDKLYVYIGGITKWRSAGMPVVTGKRDPDRALPQPDKKGA